jgi:hypothetical protein
MLGEALIRRATDLAQKGNYEKSGVTYKKAFVTFNAGLKRAPNQSLREQLWTRIQKYMKDAEQIALALENSSDGHYTTEAKEEMAVPREGKWSSDSQKQLKQLSPPGDPLSVPPPPPPSSPSPPTPPSPPSTSAVTAPAHAVS